MDATVMVDQESNHSKGFGFVTFEDQQLIILCKSIIILNEMGKWCANWQHPTSKINVVRFSCFIHRWIPLVDLFPMVYNMSYHSHLVSCYKHDTSP
jgi:hypothetical protein